MSKFEEIINKYQNEAELNASEKAAITQRANKAWTDANPRANNFGVFFKYISVVNFVMALVLVGGLAFVVLQPINVKTPLNSISTNKTEQKTLQGALQEVVANIVPNFSKTQDQSQEVITAQSTPTNGQEVLTATISSLLEKKQNGNIAHVSYVLLPKQLLSQSEKLAQPAVDRIEIESWYDLDSNRYKKIEKTYSSDKLTNFTLRFNDGTAEYTYQNNSENFDQNSTNNFERVLNSKNPLQPKQPFDPISENVKLYGELIQNFDLTSLEKQKLTVDGEDITAYVLKFNFGENSTDTTKLNIFESSIVELTMYINETNLQPVEYLYGAHNSIPTKIFKETIYLNMTEDEKVEFFGLTKSSDKITDKSQDYSNYVYNGNIDIIGDVTLDGQDLKLTTCKGEVYYLSGPAINDEIFAYLNGRSVSISAESVTYKDNSPSATIVNKDKNYLVVYTFEGTDVQLNCSTE